MSGILRARQTDERDAVEVGIDDARQEVGRPGSGRCDAAPQIARELGVGHGGLTGVDLAATVNPRDGGVGDEGINEGHNGSTMASKDVRDAGGDQRVDEELCPRV
mmetsp:Transcript_15612/g.28383  ORF Transcript_15612/g.28383 Transcript_15612/m.28383 type:complete len:105 (-) Transcript_15612:88-402(-)